MERLTEMQSSGYDLKEMNGEWCNKYCEKQRVQTCNECGIYQAIQKLAEYEDLEDKLNGISVKQVIDGFINTVKNQTNEEYEHGRILTNEEADKWNEYKQLEEQGLLLRLPCKVGGTVYCIYERYTKCSENEQEFDEYSCQGCECLECDSHKEFYVQSQKAYSLDWIVSNLKRFGKTVFFTQEEATVLLDGAILRKQLKNVSQKY